MLRIFRKVYIKTSLSKIFTNVYHCYRVLITLPIYIPFIFVPTPTLIFPNTITTLHVNFVLNTINTPQFMFDSVPAWYAIPKPEAVGVVGSRSIDALFVLIDLAVSEIGDVGLLALPESVSYPYEQHCAYNSDAC